MHNKNKLILSEYLSRTLYLFFIYILTLPSSDIIAESKIGIHSSHNEFREFISRAIPPEATLIMSYWNSITAARNGVFLASQVHFMHTIYFDLLFSKRIDEKRILRLLKFATIDR